MKKLIVLFLFTAGSFVVSSQSHSFESLRDHFSGKEDVQSFSVGGFLCRVAIRIALPEDNPLRPLMKDINHVRFIVIPNDEFEKQDVTVSGFKRLLARDSFESMATIRDKGEVVSVFHRKDGNKKDRYFVLVEGHREVVAVEMKGNIDPALLDERNTHISINQR